MIIESYTDDVKIILRELLGIVIITQSVQPIVSLGLRKLEEKNDTYSIDEIFEFYGKKLTQKNECLANSIMDDNEDSLYDTYRFSNVKELYEERYELIVTNRKQKPKFENIVLPLLQELQLSQISLLAPEKEFILFCTAKLTNSDNIQLDDEDKILHFIANAFNIEKETYEDIVNYAEKEERPTYHFIKKTVSGAIGSIFDKIKNKN